MARNSSDIQTQTIKPKDIQAFAATANGIYGSSKNLEQALKELDADLKSDLKGRKEYEAYLKTLENRKEDLQRRIDSNKAWIKSFESTSTDGANFETQYKSLVADIDEIYAKAKDGHQRGIELLKQPPFNYHPEFKRHTDKFTGTAFKPK